ncbi:MAG: hypothetical protein ACYCUG_06075 [Acidimicrobiales bacterium]
MAELSGLCACCGSPFTYPAPAGAGRRRLYCGAGCRRMASRRQHAESKAREGLVKVCRWCAGEHTLRGQYCSEPCRVEGYRARERASRGRR